MAQRRHHQNKRQAARPSAPALVRAPILAPEKKAVVTYGKPFIVLEDDKKALFIFSAGKWVQYAKSIAECRVDCQVKELSQRINGMTRYEVAAPVGS